MPLTNYEKQKRWREKNRALYNLQQRNRRKKNLGADTELTESRSLSKAGKAAEKETAAASTNLSSGLSGGEEVADVIQSLPPAQSKDETLERLRGLIKVEKEKPRVEAPAAIKVVRRSPTGMILTDEQWEARQEYERKALEKGFVPDEYSQA